MTSQSLIGSLEAIRPSPDSPELSEHAYRQAVDDCIAIIRERHHDNAASDEMRRQSVAAIERKDAFVMAALLEQYHDLLTLMQGGIKLRDDKLAARQQTSPDRLPASELVEKLEALKTAAETDDNKYGTQDTGQYWGRAEAFAEAIALVRQHMEAKPVGVEETIERIEAHFRPLYNAGRMTVGEMHMIRKTIAALTSQDGGASHEG